MSTHATHQHIHPTTSSTGVKRSVYQPINPVEEAKYTIPYCPVTIPDPRIPSHPVRLEQGISAHGMHEPGGTVLTPTRVSSLLTSPRHTHRRMNRPYNSPYIQRWPSQICIRSIHPILSDRVLAVLLQSSEEPAKADSRCDKRRETYRHTIRDTVIHHGIVARLIDMCNQTDMHV